jgi:hypothetical protein
VKQECGGGVRFQFKDVSKSRLRAMGGHVAAAERNENYGRFGPEHIPMQRAAFSSALPLPVWKRIALTAVGGLVACGLAAAAGASPDAVIGDGAASAEPIGTSWTAFTDWISSSYHRAPALVLGLVAALVAVPPLAFAGLLARRREAQSVSIAEARTEVRRIPRDTEIQPREGVRTGHIPLRPQEAWIQLENGNEVAPSATASRYGLGRTLLRIGRETDNDICLEDVTVHRYHAAVHRTEDAEFVITDLSSAGGNGVVVNGRAAKEARLSNGDTIQLGNARFKFNTGSAKG